ncbi:Ig-like domain-containing protein [Bordetella avium]|uniref:Ig-like domain-containing protein n=2 Tax=Bordetella avium TaxID=521 RepID=UPI0039FBBAB0
MYRVIWSQARDAWIVVKEGVVSHAKGSGRNRRRRAQRAASSAVCLSLGMQAAAPLAVLAQGAPEMTNRPEAGDIVPSDVLTQVAVRAQDLARRQADRREGAQVDADYLKQQGQAQFNQFLQEGVRAANESGLRFLRNLQGDLRHDFDNGRTSLELRTIDQVYRKGANTGLLQLGGHNQNNRPTANLGGVYRRDINERLMLGANAFLDYEFAKQHLRGSLGVEAIAPEFSFYGNVYAPMSGWTGAKRDNRREERPASGMDLGMKYSPGFAPGLSLKANYFRWNGAAVDYFDNGRTQDRATGFKYGVQYKPVPLLSLGVEQTRVIGGASQTSVQLGVALNLSEPLSKQLRRGGETPVFNLDAHRNALVERENRIVLNTRQKLIILPLTVTTVLTDSVSGRITLVGQTQAQATVNWTLPDGSSGQSRADASGVYRIESRKDQPSGPIRLKAVNQYGDRSREVVYQYEDGLVLGGLQVKILVMQTLPANGKLKVRGKTEPKMDVRVTFPDGEVVQLRSADDGSFTALSKQRVPRGVVQVRVTDPSTDQEAVAQDMYEPPAAVAPTIDKVTTDPATGRVTIVGEAEPRSRVEIRFSDGTTEVVDADDEGHYSATSAGDLPSGELRATRLPAAGEQPLSTRREYKDEVDKTAPEAPSITKVSTDATTGRVTVSGSAEPDVVVTVMFPDGTEKTVPTNDDGTYRATSDGNMVSGDILAHATDRAKNRSPDTRYAYADAVAPATPVIRRLTTNSTTGQVTAAGTAEPGNQVAVTFPDGTQKTVTADGEGHYTAESEGDQPSGDVKAQAVDAAGNKSPEASKNYADTVDKTPPPMPSITSVSAHPDTGHVTVQGEAEAGDQVAVTFPDGERKVVPVKDDGSYTATSDHDQPSGDITVSATDAAGNSSPELKRSYTDTVDKTAPAAPTITDVATDATTGYVTVIGTVEPDAQVTVTFPSGESRQVSADAGGAYRVSSDTDQPSGEIKAQAADAAGNKSPETSRNYVDTVDKTAPAAPTITNVATDAATGHVTVSGRAESDTQVTVTFPSGESKQVPADAGGAYRVSSDTDQPSGEIKAQAADAAGNKSPEATKAYDDTVDKTAPPLSITNVSTAPATGVVTVTGNTEAGSSVAVNFPGGQSVNVTAAADGSYTASSTRDVTQSGDITATARDAAGNVSAPATQAYNDIVDKTPPPVSITNVSTAPGSGIVTVTGVSEPGASVVVNFPGRGTARAEAAPDGGYTVSSTGPVESGAIQAVATDSHDNHSEPVRRDYLDTTAPAAPVISEVTAGPTGLVTVEGRAEVGSTVTVTFPDGASKQVPVADAGTYRVTSDANQPSGDIKASATDKARNKSPEATQVYTDQTAPAVPLISTVNTSPQTGVVTVEGTAEADSQVKVSFPDGTSKTVSADGSGHYTATSDHDQPSGEIKVQATDAANNKSPEATKAYADGVDKTPPVVSISNVQAADATGIVTVTGHTEAGSTVQVTFPDGQAVNATVDQDGSYTARSSKDVTQSGDITATATDAAGNPSAPATQAYDDTVDRTAPPVPTISSVTGNAAGQVTVVGTAEPGSTVTINFPGGSEKQVQLNADGQYSVTSDGHIPTGDIKASATDREGNKSAEVSKAYMSAPPAPVINSVTTDANTGRVTVSGTAKPNGKVLVTFPGGSQREVSVSAGGDYTATSSDDEESGEIKAVLLEGAERSRETKRNYADEAVRLSAKDVEIENGDQAGFWLTVTHSVGSYGYSLLSIQTSGKVSVKLLPSDPSDRNQQELVKVIALQVSGPYAWSGAVNVSADKYIDQNPPSWVPAGTYPVKIVVTQIATGATVEVSGTIVYSKTAV